jgi:hypothetical protein
MRRKYDTYYQIPHLGNNTINAMSFLIVDRKTINNIVPMRELLEDAECPFLSSIVDNPQIPLKRIDKGIICLLTEEVETPPIPLHHLLVVETTDHLRYTKGDITLDLLEDIQNTLPLSLLLDMDRYITPKELENTNNDYLIR